MLNRTTYSTFGLAWRGFAMTVALVVVVGFWNGVTP